MTRPWSSVAFQVALRYGVLIVLTVAVVLGMFYIQVLGTLRARFDHNTDSNLKRLQHIAKRQGLDGLAREAERLLSDGVNSDTEVVIVTDAQGHALLGNAQLREPRRLGAMGSRDLEILRHGRPHVARVLAVQLDDGKVLIVGNDMQPLDELQRLFINASIWTVLISVIIIALGAQGFRKLVEQRASAIRHTMARVAAGHLGERIPSDARQRDEFTLLHRELNHMLDQLQQLMDGIRNVSNTIAHNLRTPLTHIRLRLDQIRDHPVSPALRQDLDDFSDELLHISMIFERLLAIAEVEAGALRRQFEPVSLRNLLTEAQELYEPLIEDEGGCLTLDVQGDPVCRGDPNLLASAVSNLIENALKHGRAGQAPLQLALWARCAHDPKRGPGVWLAVSDQGPGVPPDALARLSQRFFRANASAPGLGLGLASVQAIVQLHMGQLCFDNTTPGFRVSLWLPGAQPT